MTIDIIRTLLANDICTESNSKNGRQFVILKESGADAKLKHVELYDVSQDAFLIKLDEYEQPKSLFKGTNGECKRCDYVLVTNLNKKPLLIFIELKSSKIKMPHIIKQFQGAECVIDYCDSVLDRFYDYSSVLKDIEKRFIIFYKPRSISKRRTRISPPENNKSPDKAFKYPSPYNPSINELVAP